MTSSKIPARISDLALISEPGPYWTRKQGPRDLTLSSLTNKPGSVRLILDPA